MSGVNDLPGTWNEPDGEVLDQLTHTAMFAADSEAMKPGPPSRSFRDHPPETPHEHTKRVVRATLRMLLANGLITVVPPDERPEWIVLDPPDKPLTVTVTAPLDTPGARQNAALAAGYPDWQTMVDAAQKSGEAGTE